MLITSCDVNIMIIMLCDILLPMMYTCYVTAIVTTVNCVNIIIVMCVTFLYCIFS